MAYFVCLLDLLASNPKISEDTALSGPVSATKSAYLKMWNNLDNAIDALPETKKMDGCPIEATV
ncbi:MAG: hypothetical protein ACXWTG_10815 [Methylosarcina sp.]